MPITGTISTGIVVCAKPTPDTAKSHARGPGRGCGPKMRTNSDSSPKSSRKAAVPTPKQKRHRTQDARLSDSKTDGADARGGNAVRQHKHRQGKTNGPLPRRSKVVCVKQPLGILPRRHKCRYHRGEERRKNLRLPCLHDARNKQLTAAEKLTADDNALDFVCAFADFAQLGIAHRFFDGEFAV